MEQIPITILTFTILFKVIGFGVFPIAILCYIYNGGKWNMIIKGWNGSRKQKYRVSSRLWYSVPHRASLASFLFLICVTYIKSWTHLPPPISVNSECFSVRPRALILSFITYYHNTELAFRVVLTTLTNLALKSLLKVYVGLQYTLSIEKGCWSEKIELNNVCADLRKLDTVVAVF